MANPDHRKLTFSLDTNILLDLADGFEPAHDLREFILEKGHSLVAPPTVIAELGYFAENGDTAEIKRLSGRSLKRMLEWGIQPFNCKPVGNGITQQFVRRLHKVGLLPEKEWNDGYILAETALADIPVLISNDGHLADIPAERLAAELKPHDLWETLVMRPRMVWTHMHRPQART